MMKVYDVFKGVLKTFIWIVSISVLLFILIFLIIQIPAVQNKIVHYATSSVSNKTHTKVEISHVSISFPKSVVIENFYIEDLNNDTLFFTGKAKINLSLYSLLSNKLNISSLALEDATVRLYSTKTDPMFNYNFLLTAFSDSTNQVVANSSAQSKWEFDLDQVSAKASIDARGFYNFRDKNKLALRFFAGIAKPFGNSSILPYSKQFFSGGPNSILAFQINSVGPGTYYQNTDLAGFLQLGGDIKLETNAEYRFGIYRYFKGALFVDAGNVWLLQSNPSDTGTPFVVSKFLNDLAVGAGVGLRVDVSFFILRFDLAFPFRKPWLDDNHRWVMNQINFTSSAWRKDNLVLNVTIGYPF